MTRENAMGISIGDTVYQTDCFGNWWPVTVVAGNRVCLDRFDTTVGIKWLTKCPTSFARTSEEAQELIRKEREADRAALER